MKRIKDIWKDVVSVSNGIIAVHDGIRYKRKQHCVEKLLNEDHTVNAEAAKEYVAPIIEKLNNKTWRHAQPKVRRQLCCSSKGGKWRDLYIPTLEDHIIAHMLMQASMRAFTRGMYPHCCGSVPGRGTGHVVRTVKRWMQGDKQCRYFRQAGYQAFL